ncbi:MAG TPA: hypothetical protein P5528_04545 [Steroidobacteraceae bacterium]|nr:hypothetical protein [Steroidobacteraceae bacterium]HRX88696.1 hypothetical protein [Steroidobacteraceae bacterium]
MALVTRSVRLTGIALLCAGLSLLTGCMHARIEESRSLPTQITGEEAVVVLAKPQVEGAAAEDGFMDCLGRNLARGQRSIKVHGNDEFVDKMFPWFEPGTAPTKAEAVTALLERPGVTDRIAETGVRYVVWLDGATRKTDGGGSLACGAAPGAAGCIGFGWWEKESDYEATIWDLQQAKSAGTVGTNVTGTSAIVGAVIPIPFIARVEGTACNRLSEQLREFFRGGAEPPTAAADAGAP